LWRDLADEERGVVAGAVLVTFPKEAIRLLQERVHPVPSAGVDRIDRLVADLDADDFATRRRALIDLAVLEEAAEPALHRALEDKPSAEARRSVLQLLNELELGQAGPSVLRRRRALRVLEQIGTAEAQKVLEAIAAGAPEATSTRDAKRALARLTACGPSNRKR